MKKIKVKVVVTVDDAIKFFKEQKNYLDPKTGTCIDLAIEALYEKKVRDAGDAEFDTRWASYRTGDMKG